jgi:hypothetical protein
LPASFDVLLVSNFGRPPDAILKMYKMAMEGAEFPEIQYIV